MIFTNDDRGVETSAEPPALGAFTGIITGIEKTDYGTFFVTFDLPDQLDSEGKPKFIKQELTKAEMIELHATLFPPDETTDAG